MAYTTIDDPSAYFQTALYTGNASDGLAITFDGNSDLQPDWVWIKPRSFSGFGVVTDTNRGLTKNIYPNSTDAEETNTARIQSMNSDGFTINNDSDTINKDSQNFAAWCWKANGGTTSSNGNGNITSTVQANTTAGFSIVTYTGNGTAGQTVGHGLSSQPDMIIVKKRAGGDAYGWGVWHTSLSNNNGTKQLILNTTSAEVTQDMFNDAIFPSGSATVFATGENNYTNYPSGATYVAYCFNSVQGYSKFGTLTGNADADGPFVYLGFKPAWIMYKVNSTTDDWMIFDSKRIHSATQHDYLEPNTTDAEGFLAVTFLSNGFKITEASGAKFNADGATYIYMAFAESPFVSSKGVPTTAR